MTGRCTDITAPMWGAMQPVSSILTCFGPAYTPVYAPPDGPPLASSCVYKLAVEPSEEVMLTVGGRGKPVELRTALHPVSQAGLVMRLRVEARVKQISCEGNQDIVTLQVLQADLQNANREVTLLGQLVYHTSIHRPSHAETDTLPPRPTPSVTGIPATA